MTFNQVVRGSNPRTLTSSSIQFMIDDIFYADVAELADALDLGSSSSECRFDSCHPHYSLRAVKIVLTEYEFKSTSENDVLFYVIGNSYGTSYDIKKPCGQYAHKSVRNLFDCVKSHLARKVAKSLKE